MTDVQLLENEQSSSPTSYVNELLDKMEKILHNHRQKDPALYRIIEEQKLIKAATQAAALEKRPVIAVAYTCDSKRIEPFYFKQYEQNQFQDCCRNCRAMLTKPRIMQGLCR